VSVAALSIATGASVIGIGLTTHRTTPVASVVQHRPYITPLNSDPATAASLSANAVAIATTPDNGGYWLVGSDGSVGFSGDATYYGSMQGHPLNAPMVGIAATADGRGYWLVASDGGIFTFGDAQFYGSMGGHPLNQPIVGMAATPDGRGYWLVAADGGIFCFGDAQFYGSMGGHPLNQPIVGMAATPDGRGYWEVASDGGIFTFGDAQFYGSMGGHPLNQPVVGMAATGDGGGYWLVARDGGIFTFGDAPFEGSGAGSGLGPTIMGMSPYSSGSGYALVAQNGAELAYPSGSITSPPAPSISPTWNNYDITTTSSITVSSTPPSEQTQPAPASSGYGYLETQGDGLPVRWAGDQTIDYEVNTAFAPSNGLSLVEQTFSQLAAATGLNFTFVGTTSQFPTNSRSATTVNANGQTIWAPILVAWEPPGYTDYLPNSGNIIGMGGASAAYDGRQWVYVTGEAAISSTYAFTQDQLASVVHHELGHVIGLGHVNDPSEVMNPIDNYNAPVTYQWGDLAGLAHLGQAEGTLPTPAP
jgi:hypothetical protein